MILKPASDTVLVAHDPYPAYIVDRLWNVMASNLAAQRLVALVFDDELPPAEIGANLLKLSLHPEGLRPHLVDWEDAASTLLARAHREAHDDPTDTDLQRLLDEVLAYADVSDLETATSFDPVVGLHIRVAGKALRMVSMISTIAGPGDLTLSELRLETALPMDHETSTVLHDLAGRGPA